MTECTLTIYFMNSKLKRICNARLPLMLVLSFMCSMCLMGCGTAISSRLLCYEEDQPFVDLREKIVHLKRPLEIFLLEEEMGKADKDEVYLFFSHPPFQPDIGGTNHIPAILPVGTKIELKDFRCDKEYFVFLFVPFPLSLRYTVYFKVPEMNLRPDADFKYIWGKGLYLHRAPWEDESVPKSRYVGLNGRGYGPIKKDEVKNKKP